MFIPDCVRRYFYLFCSIVEWVIVGLPVYCNVKFLREAILVWEYGYIYTMCPRRSDMFLFTDLQTLNASNHHEQQEIISEIIMQIFDVISYLKPMYQQKMCTDRIVVHRPVAKR
jgi:hypothetical protein